MNKSQIMQALVITRREVRDQFRDWRIIFPILGLTIFFPFLMNFTTAQVLQFVNRYGASIVGERLVPFSMMIVGFFPPFMNQDSALTKGLSLFSTSFSSSRLVIWLLA